MFIDRQYIGRESHLYVWDPVWSNKCCICWCYTICSTAHFHHSDISGLSFPSLHILVFNPKLIRLMLHKQPVQLIKVLTVVSIVAPVYIIAFLKEETGETDPLEQPILKETKSNEHSCKASNKINFIQKIPCPRDAFHLLKNYCSDSTSGPP
ncbi:hypothetical protein ACS0TY_023795 [Phlomoides rotata]